MSISVPSDIVLGVANAADPQQYRAAVDRLVRAADERSAIASGQAKTTTGTKTTPQPATTAAAELSSPQFSSACESRLPQPDAYEDFEAFFLQTFVQSMLPKDATSLFGSGPGGEIWKSMLAEHIAKELASSTAFGIAEKIAEHRQEKSGSIAQAEGQHSDSSGRLQAEAQQAEYLSDLRKILTPETHDAGLQLNGTKKPSQFLHG